MEKSKSFQDLVVWQKAHKLTLEVYRITKSFPKEETYGLVSQMRRSSSSVPTNIVEGYRKRGVKDKANFMNIAEGSIEELRYQLILSKDLSYINIDEFDQQWLLAEEVSKMLGIYRRAILNSNS